MNIDPEIIYQWPFPRFLQVKKAIQIKQYLKDKGEYMASKAQGFK